MSPTPDHSLVSRLLLCLLALIPVLSLGILHLPHPFDGDQALIMVGARALEDGGRLYVDFWDNKQPGIYLFYWLAGKLFGFNEVGAHTLELIWYSGLAVWMTLGLRTYFRRPWLAALVPLASVGLFYGMSDKWHLTQVEALASLPLFGCLVLSTDLEATGGRQFRRWFLSGLCAGGLVTFKQALAPLAMVIWTVGLSRCGSGVIGAPLGDPSPRAWPAPPSAAWSCWGSWPRGLPCTDRCGKWCGRRSFFRWRPWPRLQRRLSHGSWGASRGSRRTHCRCCC